jgi:hypothetical protein
MEDSVFSDRSNFGPVLDLLFLLMRFSEIEAGGRELDSLAKQS